MYKYRLSKTTLKAFQKLPKNTQITIIKKVKFYCQSDPLIYATKLTNNKQGQYRFRIGNYRIIFDIDQENQLVSILALGHRREIYK